MQQRNVSGTDKTYFDRFHRNFYLKLSCNLSV